MRVKRRRGDEGRPLRVDLGARFLESNRARDLVDLRPPTPEQTATAKPPRAGVRAPPEPRPHHRSLGPSRDLW